MEDPKQELKVIMVGDANVGKTSIVTRYTSGEFNKNTNPTVGASLLTKDIVFEGKQYTLNIWDTAGQETYRYLVPMYYRNASIAIIVFDLTNAKSFNSVTDWIDDVTKNVGDELVCIVCGNKCDLETSRTVSIEDIQDLERSTNTFYVETSASDGTGIAKLFEIAISEFHRKNPTHTTSKNGVELEKTASSSSCSC